MRNRAVPTHSRAALAALAAAALLAVIPATASAMPFGADGHHAAAALGLGKPDRRPVPILMYHVIQRPYADSPYPDLYVPRAEFAAQMELLERRGYQAVTLDRVHDAWHGNALLPAHPIVISFDDGYRSHYSNALPILEQHRWPGVLNLDASNLEPSWGIQPRMVRELIAAGWEIDAHSLTHADVSGLSGAALRREVAGSRAAIRRLFGVEANFFCYPAGRYDSEAIEAVRAAGFLGATTTEAGFADLREPFSLARVRVDGGDGAEGLARKLDALTPA